MEGFSIWTKINRARLELNGKNSIYRSRKTVCLFTINCDCTGDIVRYIYKYFFLDFMLKILFFSK